MQHKHLPVVPQGVRVKSLAANLKLYSDEEIAAIKARITSNGRYHFFPDAGGNEKLKYTVYVMDGRYFAIYPGKKLLLGDGEGQFGKPKVAQDLDTGEWVVDKVMWVHPNVEDLFCEDIENEVQALLDNQQAVLTKDAKPVFFHRPFKGENADDVNGKYDVFMKYAEGMDLQEWMNRCAQLPVVVLIDMSISLVQALMSVHEKKMLHRDVKPRNAVFDLFQSPENATQMIDFGFALPLTELREKSDTMLGTPGYMAPEIERLEEDVIAAKYSFQTDVYALGVTLGVLWGLYELKDGALLRCAYNKKFPGDFAMKRGLQRMLDVMLHVDGRVRPELDDVDFFLKKMKSLLPDEHRVVRVGVLDVSAWQDACAHGDKQALLNKLKNYDYVQLLDSAGTCRNVELLAVKQSLQHHNCITANDVLVGGESELKDYMAERDGLVQDDGRIYRMTHVEHASRLQMNMDGQPAIHNAEAEEDAEEYSWSDCLSWFFGAIRDDIYSIMPACSPQITGHGFGTSIFSLSNSPEERRTAAALTAAFDEVPFYDSDDEVLQETIALARY